MAGQSINFPPLRYETPFAENGKITPDAHRALLQLYNGHPLIPVSTAAGAQTVRVPLAKLNQNVEITYVKTSADGNVATLVPSGNDLINANGAWASVALPMGAAQGSKVRLKSDGQSSWYQVG